MKKHFLILLFLVTYYPMANTATYGFISQINSSSQSREILLKGIYNNEKARGQICDIPIKVHLLSERLITFAFVDMIEQINVIISENNNVILNEIFSISAGETITLDLPLLTQKHYSLRLTTPQGTDCSGFFSIENY